eukprot:CAMPEP_0172932180 /NCGR_PEP_ID=MMETSP1075-20121228/219870_1 /TAXON_ID=2916 /ORGANISM="Ceratium fusus, Strain PA161109" /LENGTH=107 /DNA_ID=CAMNT_0013793505 /DNA_START=1058 /DNA_END=1377 /DNA_ORIENTATION=+
MASSSKSRTASQTGTAQTEITKRVPAKSANTWGKIGDRPCGFDAVSGGNVCDSGTLERPASDVEGSLMKPASNVEGTMPDIIGVSGAVRKGRPKLSGAASWPVVAIP